MAVTYVNRGSLVANAATTSISLDAPACNVDDVHVAIIYGKSDQVISPPDGTWTNFVEFVGGSTRLTLSWKRATASGGSFAFTKPTDDNILFCGVITTWRGCTTSATPIDATTPSTSSNASSDTVSYADFNPTETTGHCVAVGAYAEDATTAGSIAGTDPAFTNHVDVETPTGSDASIFVYSGDSSGAATGARSHSTTSTTDAGSLAVIFGLVAAAAASGNAARAMRHFRQRRAA
jgi:hypothetical protein